MMTDTFFFLQLASFQTDDEIGWRTRTSRDMGSIQIHTPRGVKILNLVSPVKVMILVKSVILVIHKNC